MDNASCPCKSKMNFPWNSNVQKKSNAKINTIWFGSLENFLHSKSMEKYVMTKPEGVMKKLNNVLLKMTKIKCLLEGKNVPFINVWKVTFLGGSRC